MKYATYPENTLIINRNDSVCYNCGKSCDPKHKTHEINLGWNHEINGTPGCGIEWKYVTTHYWGETMVNAVKEMRPDLEFIGAQV
jgi:hypothetical protein